MNTITHSHINCNNIKLHVAETGKEHNDAILFLHGFPEFWYAWRHPLVALGKHFHCIAPDTRGVNLSDRPTELSAYEIAHLAEDAYQLIDRFSDKPTVVVGHDWGGFTAWELAKRYPEAIRKLVIINAPHGDLIKRLLIDSPAQQAASQYALAFRSERGEELLSRNNFASFRSNILEPGLAAGHLQKTDVEHYLAAWQQPGGLTGGLNYYRANRYGPTQDGDATQLPETLQASTIKIPTLVIWGEKDPYFASGEILELLPDYVEDVRIERFRDNDHWIVHQIPDQITALIEEFATT